MTTQGRGNSCDLLENERKHTKLVVAECSDWDPPMSFPVDFRASVMSDHEFHESSLEIN